MSEASKANVTSLNRPWVIKTVLITLVLWAFGCWAIYDAVSLYPDRGRAYAEKLELEYLRTLESSGSFRTASTADPVAELDRLEARQSPSDIELRRLEWFKALKLVGDLEPANTTFDDPRDRFEALDAAWAGKGNPKPLAVYDIPSQWAILIVCWAIAAYMTLRFVMVAVRKYRWDPETKALTLPDKSVLTPGDLDDVDKRKWDKFIVFLKVKPDHDRHGGKELKVDLYQHAKLEPWVLEMEAAAFPDRAAEAAAEAKAAEAEQDAGEPETDTPASEEDTGDPTPPTS